MKKEKKTVDEKRRKAIRIYVDRLIFISGIIVKKNDGTH